MERRVWSLENRFAIRWAPIIETIVSFLFKLCPVQAHEEPKLGRTESRTGWLRFDCILKYETVKSLLFDREGLW